MRGLIPPPGPAYGDTISGTNLAGGIAAALLQRERTGEPSVVDVSLLGSGLWAMGHALAVTLHLGQRPGWHPPPGAHGSPTNPLVRPVRTADGRYISFVMLQPAKFWADVCQHIDRPELADDPRFATAEQIAANTAEAVELLTEVIATRTLAEWAERFATLAGPWAPVQDTLQAASDAQVRANEYIVQAGELELVANPVQFDVAAPQLGPAPEFAEQTEEILHGAGPGLGPDHRAQERRRGHLDRTYCYHAGRPVRPAPSIGSLGEEALWRAIALTCRVS